MLFQIDEKWAINGLEGLAGPGIKFYPLVEVSGYCLLFHVDLTVHDPVDNLTIGRMFISTQIEPVLQLAEDENVEAISISLQEQNHDTGEHKISRIAEVIQPKTINEIPGYIYVLKNGEKVFDLGIDENNLLDEMTSIYRHGRRPSFGE